MAALYGRSVKKTVLEIISKNKKYGQLRIVSTSSFAKEVSSGENTGARGLMIDGQRRWIFKQPTEEASFGRARDLFEPMKPGCYTPPLKRLGLEAISASDELIIAPAETKLKCVHGFTKALTYNVGANFGEGRSWYVAVNKLPAFGWDAMHGVNRTYSFRAAFGEGRAWYVEAVLAHLKLPTLRFWWEDWDYDADDEAEEEEDPAEVGKDKEDGDDETAEVDKDKEDGDDETAEVDKDKEDPSDTDSSSSKPSGTDSSSSDETEGDPSTDEELESEDEMLKRLKRKRKAEEEAEAIYDILRGKRKAEQEPDVSDDEDDETDPDSGDEEAEEEPDVEKAEEDIEKVDPDERPDPDDASEAEAAGLQRMFGNTDGPYSSDGDSGDDETRRRPRRVDDYWKY